MQHERRLSGPRICRPSNLTQQNKEVVEALREQIMHLHARGWSVAGIAQVISDAGIPVTAATVRGVLKPRPRRSRKKSTATAVAIPTP
jgi:hypothetical protein